MRLKTLFLLSMFALGSAASPAFAKEPTPKPPRDSGKTGSKSDAFEGFDADESKCVSKCQEPMVKCVKKCGSNPGCMEGCSKDLGQCMNGCGMTQDN